MGYRQSTPLSSTRRMAKSRRHSALWTAFIALVGLAAIGLLINNSGQLALPGGAVLLLLILMRVGADLAEQRVARSLKREKQALRGARAEETIECLLDELGHGYLVVNDVPSPHGNIDHLVLSDQGTILVIETKSHHGRVELVQGRLTIDGRSPEKDFIHQILSNTYWLRECLAPILGAPPWVTPLLVFTNAYVPRLPKTKGVRIVNQRFLIETIKSSEGKNSRVWPARNAIWEAVTS